MLESRLDTKPSPPSFSDSAVLAGCSSGWAAAGLSGCEVRLLSTSALGLHFRGGGHSFPMQQAQDLQNEG